jgi:hypothetical protein
MIRLPPNAGAGDPNAGAAGGAPNIDPVGAGAAEEQRYEIINVSTCHELKSQHMNPNNTTHLEHQIIHPSQEPGHQKSMY